MCGRLLKWIWSILSSASLSWYNFTSSYFCWATNCRTTSARFFPLFFFSLAKCKRHFTSRYYHFEPYNGLNAACALQSLKMKWKCFEVKLPWLILVYAALKTFFAFNYFFCGVIISLHLMQQCTKYNSIVSKRKKKTKFSLFFPQTLFRP